MVTITRETSPQDAELYRARVNGYQALGRTAGEALNGLSRHLAAAGSTLVLVQRLGPDEFFGAAQMERLRELMAHWRTARNEGAELPPAQQEELEALISSELDASARRAAGLGDQLAR